ncbi:2-hydroxyacid dehydrogenase [Pengzhenrongella sicca]|uniref:2-hydroxyacid dehydrogenase n=1 Tax=Pengzhenrongella sicca TaxID=2819238 RepID=A0A8A4ZM24_9MICO|nr:2-hydroxyacid dehydrogenase [Pengzhenrongella sicca]
MTVPDAATLADLVPPPGVRLVVWDLRRPLDPDVAREVDAVVVPPYFLDPAGFGRLRGLPRLSFVQLPSAGYEHVLPHLPPGITLGNGRGVHDDETAELALALVLASQRGLDDALRQQAAGVWTSRVRASLADRRVLVLGHGSVGSAIVARLEPFKVDIVRVARTARDEPGGHVHGVNELPELLPTVDVVIVIVPLTPETERLVDARFLALMPDGALLVNVARGKVVDTAALLVELESGRLRAALDVTDPEPLPAGHPLWAAPGVIITPHEGGNTTASHSRMVAVIQAQLGRLVAGEAPANVVAQT